MAHSPCGRALLIVDIQREAPGGAVHAAYMAAPADGYAEAVSADDLLG